MMKTQIATIALIFSICISSSQAQMIADLTEDVQTAFGTYHPYLATFKPDVPLFTVESDFHNITNYSHFEGILNEIDREHMIRNHFTVKKSQYKQLFDIYNKCTWSSTPIFVTTDAVLHIYHVLFDRFLAEIEVQRFVETLDLLTQSLIDEALSLYDQSTNLEVREAAHLNLAFLCVSQKLLRGTDWTVPEPVSALVDSELVLISNHDGFHYSPIFDEFNQLDYSQFQVRGHYTKNDTLKNYFKAMMWYGWTIFTMEPDLFGDLAKRHTLQALMLAQMVYRLEADAYSLFDLWERIYEPTIFFVGKTDDPNIKDYKEIADQIYGINFVSMPPDSIANSSLLGAFMNEVHRLPEPKIPNYLYGTTSTYKGFRFMGQRFIPDSYMFAHLVFPEVGDRYFPKGLDVMAILGSDRAYTLLDSVYHETSYTNYAEKIAEFRLEFSSKPSEAWAQNLYWNWLYCLMSLLYKKEGGYPFFMQTRPWSNKELLTALASWVELRHDTILYAKQSSTPRSLPPGPPRSYVEPNPYLYARLASLVRFTRVGLEHRDLLLEGFREKLDLFENVLLFLRDVSIKELENIPLSDLEYDNIYTFGKVMEALVSDADLQTPWEGDPDDMAVIADVHTDMNTNQALEEGVGYPLEIFVIVNEGGTIRITRGAMFSYYEFTQPISERLTDEAWREMLTGDSPPPMPQWVSSFMDTTEVQPPFAFNNPGNKYDRTFTGATPIGEELLPSAFVLHEPYPNPFNPATTIEFSMPKRRLVTLTVYDILGREIDTILNQQMNAGHHKVQWNANNVPSGIYFIKMQTGSFSQVRKGVVVR